jgi:peptidoglycan/LPS O-acetylase OafA/YrhL
VAPNLLEACCVVLAVAFAATTPPGGTQYAFPLLAAIVIYVFSFDQGEVSAVLRSPPLQKLGLWSYSVYMIHTFVFQLVKMAASLVGHKTHFELVGWHNNEKLMMLGTPGQALLPALILSVVLVVPVAALTYRWIEKPAMDEARLRIASPVTWLGAVSATSGAVAILRLRVKSLVLSTGHAIAHGLDAVAAMPGSGRNGILLPRRRGSIRPQ